MAISAGYWVDLRGVKFAEGSDETWIQAMPMGVYEHPSYGTITIDTARVKNFADNVNNNVRTQQLDIDYDHKAQSGEAAGWVKSADARADGLWLLVEWTKSAATKIKEKAYRYFSPEFHDEWTHPKNNMTFKDVLFGGAITNRPFLKDILPINMSEVFEATRLEEPQKQEGKGMDHKELRKLLGMPEDAPDELVTTKLGELMAPKKPTPEEEAATKKVAEEAAAKALAESKSGLPDDIKKLSEDNPAIKKLVEMFETQGRSLAETQVALRMSEIDTSVVKLAESAKQKGYAFPPATLDEVKKLLTEAPSKAFADQVFKAFEKMGTVGLVQLGEKGSTRGGERTDGDAVKLFTDEVAKVMKEDPKVDYAGAVSKIASEQPELYDGYRQTSYAGKE